MAATVTVPIEGEGALGYYWGGESFLLSRPDGIFGNTSYPIDDGTARGGHSDGPAAYLGYGPPQPNQNKWFVPPWNREINGRMTKSWDDFARQNPFELSIHSFIWQTCNPDDISAYSSSLLSGLSPSTISSPDSSLSNGQGTTSFNCKYCAARFWRRRDYVRHMHRHVESYPCSGCPKEFRSKSDRKRHTREVHYQRSDLQSANTCPAENCRRHRDGFSRRWNLTEHIRRRHAGEYLDYIPRGSDSLAADGAHNSTPSRLGGSPEAGEDSPNSTSRPYEGTEEPQQLRTDIENELSSLRNQRHKIDGKIVELKSKLKGLDQECTTSLPGC